MSLSRDIKLLMSTWLEKVEVNSDWWNGNYANQIEADTDSGLFYQKKNALVKKAQKGFSKGKKTENCGMMCETFIFIYSAIDGGQNCSYISLMKVWRSMEYNLADEIKS